MLGLFAFAAAAQPVWQSSQTAVGTGNATVTKPASTVSGDLLVVGLMVEKGSGETITAPGGWALIRRTNQGSNAGMATYYKVAGGAEPASYTFNIANGSKWSIGISRITGADSSSPIVVHQGQTGGGGMNVTAPSVTTTVANALVVAFYTNKKAATYTAAGTTTERYDAPNNAGGLPSNMMASFVQGSAGATGNRVATASEAEAWVGQQVAIRPSSMVGSPPPAPSLVSPADGATVMTATPDFDWTDVTDPDGDTVTYDIQADNSGCAFSSPEVNQTGLAASTHTPGASLADATYCWRARAVDSNGNASAWSATRNVTIDAVTVGSQTRSPTSSADCTPLGGPDADWSNQGNAASSDNQHATATVDGTITDPLRCLNYAFAIPPNATILGVVVNVERRSNRTQNGGSRDNTLYLAKAGAAVGANRATSTTYTTSDVVEAHGNASDLWGTTWTPAEINAANFGALFTATKPNAAGTAHIISVDHIQITVHYSFPNVVTPGSFNAFESSTAANAITGTITTKIAGGAFTLDVVAISAGAQQSGFTGAVTVELLGNNTLGIALDADNCPVSSTSVQTVSPDPTISAGRSTVGFAAVADSWRDVRVRIRFPATSPTVTSCSTDNFAIRPSALANLGARDQDWETAGVTRLLDDVTITAPPGGKLHKAGRPFSVRATAQNAAAATTANYAGTPSVNASACTGAACTATAAALTLNSTFSSGQLATDVASYPEVGAFQLQLVDSAFASVDSADTAADCTASGRYVCSATVNVGRFVPDHFAVVSSSITPRTDIPACSGSSFTYMGERMDVQMSLEARALGGTLTSYYEGALARLNPTAAGSYSFGAIDSAAPTPLSSRITLLAITGSWSGGVATVTAPISIERGAGPDGPFSSTRIGIAPADPDGVTLASFNLDADNSGANERVQLASTALRFGRLRLENAVGSEKLDLRIPMQTQYWNGIVFAQNTEDTCTSISAGNIAFGNYHGGITAGNMGPANISGLAAAFSSGYFTLTKPTPTPAAAGAVTVTIDLSAEAKSYLKGNWGVSTFSADPSSRAAFGLYGGQPNNFIYFRENY